LSSSGAAGAQSGLDLETAVWVVKIGSRAQLAPNEGTKKQEHPCVFAKD